MEVYLFFLISFLCGCFFGYMGEKKRTKTIVVKVPVPTPIELPNNIILWIEVDK